MRITIRRRHFSFSHSKRERERERERERGRGSIRRRNYLSCSHGHGKCTYSEPKKRITNTWITRARDPWHWSRKHIRDYLCTLNSYRIYIYITSLFFPLTFYLLSRIHAQISRIADAILYSMFSTTSKPEGSLEWKGEGTKPGCDSRNRWEKTRWIWWWLRSSMIGSLGRCIRFPKIELRGG